MKKFFVFIFLAAMFVLAAAPAKKAVKSRKASLPPEVKAIDYPCSIDNSKQKAMFFAAKGKQKRPLLVALHTWGGTYQQNCSVYASYCVKNNWNFIFPHFRGQNWTTDACGSDKVVQDIADAVAYMKKVANVDDNKVYLIGGSGGGHATLLLAGRHPELWTAVSAWCPISDIAAWHKECSSNRYKNSYAKHMERVCGGNPQKDAKAMEQAKKRSPLTYLENAASVKVDISTGIHDGHTGSVPVSHALNAFNALADEKDRISAEDIAYITREQKIPEKFGKPEKDPVFGRKTVLFRRRSRQVRITLFKGGHDILGAAGMSWLAKQSKDKAADWSINKKGKAAKAAELNK